MNLLLDKKLNITPVDGIFRNIVERSFMINNDEKVVYSSESGHCLMFGGDEPHLSRLVISRPHFTCEGDIYLDPAKWDRENAPKITLFLDDVFRLKEKIDKAQGLGWSPTAILANIIASEFYCCMSGGMPIYMGQLIREICLDSRIKKDALVYPGKGDDEWFTIEDFLEEFTPLDEDFIKLLE